MFNAQYDYDHGACKLVWTTTLQKKKKRKKEDLAYTSTG